jgi:signal transduction histidine kinase/ligand-binding sensor domain-containing protein
MRRPLPSLAVKQGLRAFLAACFFLWLGGMPGFCGQGSGDFKVDVWRAEAGGLPQRSVIALAQTRDGYLWVGTGNGLARFDGLHFRTYGEEEIPGLNGSKIVKLFEDSRGVLWIGTETAGVLMVERDGKVSRLPLGKSADEERLAGICEDAQGGVWLSVATGQLYRWSEGRSRLLLQDNRGLVAEDSGLVWIGTVSGKLFGLGPIRAGSGDAMSVSGEVQVGKAPFLAPSRHGGYWCLVEGRIQKRQGERLVRDLGNYQWDAAAPVLAACEDLDGNLVVGTYGDGVWWFDAEGHAKKIPVSHSYIYSLLMDREGNLWVGTDGGGLNRVRRSSFELVEATRGATVQSVSEDSKGGLWVGYNGERVDHWFEGQALRSYTEFLPRLGRGKSSSFNVHSVFEDREGRVWAGSLNGDLPKWFLFQLKKEAFGPVIGVGAPQNTVSAIFQDRRGVMWFGTDSGLVRAERSEWKTLGLAEGLTSERVRALAEDSQTNLWIGTSGGGLNCLRSGKITALRKADGLPSDDITSIYIDERDVVWAGTPSGLARLERGGCRRFGTQQGLASNKIGYILEDGRGYLWLGSPAGLMRVSRKELDAAISPRQEVACRVFGGLDGVSECTAGSQPAACRARDGRLYFPTADGLISLNPAKMPVNTNPPQVVIESVRVDDVPQGSDALRAAAPGSVTVPANKESLQISFSGLSLSAADKVQFRYRLEPYEAGWTALSPAAGGAATVVHYTKLPPGDYAFRVTACNEDGYWNEQGRVLAVRVLPPFWKTPWFLTLSGVLLLGLVAGTVHLISTQRLQRQLAVMRQHEALEAERSRIARDLHDQLGANLTQISLLGEMAEADKELPDEVESHARQICQTAGETTRSLDEIVWTVNPANDTVDGLLNYICKYAQEYLALAELKYRLEVPPQLPQTPITPELRHNVFLAAKESVNNVIKHAHAESAWVRLRLEGRRFVIEIEDNGRGLSPEAEKKGRNGLKNMRKRLQDVGGTFEIGPGAQGGTLVRLTAPLPAAD